MKFVCIDFETANSFRGSICAIGAVALEHGMVTDRYYSLVKPHAKCAYFDPFNITIHGIHKNDVEDAPEFDEIYTQLKKMIDGAMLAAHNASFDMSALRHVLDLYGLPYPEIGYICSYKLAAKAWPGLVNHKLDTVSRHLDFTFQHHNALADAEACAHIIKTVTQNQTGLDELLHSMQIKPGRLFEKGYTPCSFKPVKIEKSRLPRGIHLPNNYNAGI